MTVRRAARTLSRQSTCLIVNWPSGLNGIGSAHWINESCSKCRQRNLQLSLAIDRANRDLNVIGFLATERNLLGLFGELFINFGLVYLGENFAKVIDFSKRFFMKMWHGNCFFRKKWCLLPRGGLRIYVYCFFNRTEVR